jgi:hypothetical protein
MRALLVAALVAFAAPAVAQSRTAVEARAIVGVLRVTPGNTICAQGAGLTCTGLRQRLLDVDILQESIYSGGKQTGAWREYHPSGALRLEGQLAAGRPVGTVTTFRPDGSIEHIERFDAQGRQHGVSTYCSAPGVCEDVLYISGERADRGGPHYDDPPGGGR